MRRLYPSLPRSSNDLQSYQITVEASGFYDPIDNSVSASNCDITAIFRHHKEYLLDLINTYPYVCGCVAWLTDSEILAAMAQMEHVSIVVQKEDFLRPEGIKSRFHRDLRDAYEALPSKFTRPSVNNEIIKQLSNNLSPDIDPVRCMGNHNSDKSPTFPRMHNKFLIFTEGVKSYRVKSIPNPHTHLKGITDEDQLGDEVEISLGISDNACVWTGSYNISNTATKSLENAIIIHNKNVAEAYFNEWAQITALSEPLDWQWEWSAPEWQISVSGQMIKL